MRREFPEAPIVGVGAVVIDDNSVLLVLRGQAPLKGEWSIPGGALELGETLAAGVRREVLEETGLEVRVLGLTEVVDRIAFSEQDDGEGITSAARVQYHYVLIDFLCEMEGGELRCGSDADDACWVKREDLKNYGLAHSSAAVIQKAFEMRGRYRLTGTISEREP